MAENETSFLVLVVVALVAVLGLGLALASFATNESMSGMMNGGYGGGMMNRTGTTGSAPGGLEWGILLVSAAFLALAVVLLVRARGMQARGLGMVVATPAPAPSGAVVPSAAAAPAPPTDPAPTAGVSGPAGLPEPTLVKLLDADEKRMYLELRDHGGRMYQRDLVALGMFSKAKVTRVLDKLEAKGLLVREAHGMTNLVRLVHQPAK